jgi:hypothetical protein
MNNIGSAEFINDITLEELRSATCVIHTIANARTYALNGPAYQPLSSVVPFPTVVLAPVEVKEAVVV